MSGTRNQMWKNFVKFQIQLLDEWHFTGTKCFMRCFWNLYNDLNKCAYPLVIRRKVVEIPHEMFTTIEFQLLGFMWMWDVYELPLDNLKIVHIWL
jgi:hypothetical protein